MSAGEIASILEDAPAWALIGLTAPSECLRGDARLEVAEHLLRSLGNNTPAPETGQLPLPLA